MIAFCHCAVYRVKIIGTVCIGIPSLDHVAICVVPYPFADVSGIVSFRFLIQILIGCLLAAIYGIQPVPGICARIKNFLTTALQSLLYSIFIPVVITVNDFPAEFHGSLSGERIQYAC